MPSRRDLIRMTDDEMRSFIRERKNLQVATLGKDGIPHLTTLWYAVLDGDIVFETFSKSQKVVNLKRDSRISVLMEDGLQYDKLRGVSIQGRAELSEDPEVVFRVARAVVEKNQPEVPEESRDDVARMMAQKRTAVFVKPEKIVTWDHNKLGGRY